MQNPKHSNRGHSPLNPADFSCHVDGIAEEKEFVTLGLPAPDPDFLPPLAGIPAPPPPAPPKPSKADSALRLLIPILLLIALMALAFCLVYVYFK